MMLKNFADVFKQYFSMKKVSNVCRKISPVPFPSLSKFKFNKIHLYKYSYKISVSSAEQLRKYFYQFVLVQHEIFILLAPQRKINFKEQKFELRVKFWSKVEDNIETIVKDPSFSTRQLIELLKKVSLFVLYLHKNHYFLLTPLEECILINKKENNKPLFYFFDNFDNLVHRLDSMNKEKLELMKDIYPVEEIKSSCTM